MRDKESNNSQKWVKTPTFGYYSVLGDEQRLMAETASR